MNQSIHKSQTEKVVISIAAGVIRALPLLLRAYHELRTRLKPGSGRVMVMPKELASSLKCDVGDLHVVFKDLSMLGVIKYEPGRWGRSKWTITILVV
jgi:hypothetical protein